MIPPFLPFDKPNLCYDYIFIDPEYNDRLCFLNQVDSNINLFDNVMLQQVVMHSTKKSRSVGPHKSRTKTKIYKKNMHQNKKFWSASTQLRRGSTEPNRNRQIYYNKIYSTQTKSEELYIHQCWYIYPNCYLEIHEESLTHHKR